MDCKAPSISIIPCKIILYISFRNTHKLDLLYIFWEQFSIWSYILWSVSSLKALYDCTDPLLDAWPCMREIKGNSAEHLLLHINQRKFSCSSRETQTWVKNKKRQCHQQLLAVAFSWVLILQCLYWLYCIDRKKKNVHRVSTLLKAVVKIMILGRLLDILSYRKSHIIIPNLSKSKQNINFPIFSHL